MIVFIDGPAQGQKLMLRRAPIMLRVVRGRGDKFDALDQPTDEASAIEKIWVYRLTGPPGMFHVLIRGKGKGESGFYASGEYSYLIDQPADEHVRTTAAWKTWCEANRESLLPEWAKKG